MLHIPERLEDYLHRSRLLAPVIGLRDAVGLVLAQNAMPFFPEYTDHGEAHVQGVLNTIDLLIPDSALELLTDVDVAVTVGATLLHDIGMHLREDQFLELVTEGGAPRLSTWFASRQGNRAPDIPWPLAWDNFKREVRRLPQSQLAQILGSGGQRAPLIAAEEDNRSSRDWTKNDRLIIGEFLRRHHARIAHEIALAGWPAAPDTLPVLRSTMPSLADAVGLVARSHNESLRRMLAYASWRSPTSERPWGAYIAYSMALLRIADYFQIDQKRAPAVLLHLINPQSPISVREWDTHAAVATITWQTNAQAYIEASGTHSLGTHLHLEQLLAAIQDELDTTMGVLDDLYRGPLAALRLSIRRVTSNLSSPGLLAELPYVPAPTSVTATLDLVRLLVGPLYGDNASIAGRELLQNAVDAVRARRRLAAEIPDPEFDADEPVVIRISEIDESTAMLEVQDHGVGMTPDTVRQFFLAAGASLGLTQGEVDEMTEGNARLWLKTGRFGIGALASFTLGTRVRVTTRHVTSDRAITFEVDLLGRNVQLDWDDGAEVGTTVQVFFEPSHVSIGSRTLKASSEEQRARLYIELAAAIRDWWRSTWPRVDVPQARPVIRPSGASDVPDAYDNAREGWTTFEAPGLTRAMWKRRSVGGRIVHNGFLLAKHSTSDAAAYEWSSYEVSSLVSCPDLALVDAGHALPLTLRRDSMQSQHLPFEYDLLFSIGREMALEARKGVRELRFLVPNARVAVHGPDGWLPFIPTLLRRLDVHTATFHMHLQESLVPGLATPRSAISRRRDTETEHGRYRIEVKAELELGFSFADAVQTAIRALGTERQVRHLDAADAIYAVAWGAWEALQWQSPSGEPMGTIGSLKHTWPIVARTKNKATIYGIYGDYDAMREIERLKDIVAIATDVVREERGFTLVGGLSVTEIESGEDAPVADGWQSVLSGFAPPIPAA